MGVLFVFIDGLGFGRADPASNPVADAGLGLGLLGPLLAAPGGPPAPGTARPVRFRGRSGWVTSADACLGVRGLPQSATGQTTLLTGINAPAFAGRHVNAYPTGRLRALLEGRNLLTLGSRAGRRVTFLNMFRPDGLRLLLEGKRRPSATTAAALAAGLRLRTVEDLLRGQAVYHDVTCWTIQGQHYGVPLATPTEAARRALAVAAEHDFTLFEYFLTDLAGHSQERELTAKVLGVLDDFLTEVVGSLPPGHDEDSAGGVAAGGLTGLDDLAVVAASDHGNVEDSASRTHTRNPVAVVAFGPDARGTVEGIRDISQVAARLARLAGIPGVPPGGGGPRPETGSEGER